MTAWAIRNYWYDKFVGPMKYLHYYKDSSFLPFHELAMAAEQVNGHVVWQVADDLYSDIFHGVIYDRD